MTFIKKVVTKSKNSIINNLVNDFTNVVDFLFL